MHVLMHACIVNLSVASTCKWNAVLVTFNMCLCLYMKVKHKKCFILIRRQVTKFFFL
jgi:hypothetical protein